MRTPPFQGNRRTKSVLVRPPCPAPPSGRDGTCCFRISGRSSGFRRQRGHGGAFRNARLLHKVLFSSLKRRCRPRDAALCAPRFFFSPRKQLQDAGEAPRPLLPCVCTAGPCVGRAGAPSSLVLISQAVAGIDIIVEYLRKISHHSHVPRFFAPASKEGESPGGRAEKCINLLLKQGFSSCRPPSPECGGKATPAPLPCVFSAEGAALRASPSRKKRGGSSGNIHALQEKDMFPHRTRR